MLIFLIVAMILFIVKLDNLEEVVLGLVCRLDYYVVIILDFSFNFDLQRSNINRSSESAKGKAMLKVILILMNLMMC